MALREPRVASRRFAWCRRTTGSADARDRAGREGASVHATAGVRRRLVDPARRAPWSGRCPRRACHRDSFDLLRAPARNAPIAPGTVGMHPSTSYMRRSRLKPMTYSRCCQRPSSRSRFPTLVLPETAPTVWSRERLDQRRAARLSRTRCRRRTVTMTSPVAARCPRSTRCGFAALACLMHAVTVRLRR